MLVVHRLRVMKPIDIFFHHPRSSHPGTDDGAGRHQGLIIGTTQLAQKPSHRRTLDVETTTGLGLEQLSLDKLVLFQCLHPMDVDMHAVIAFHHLHRVADVSDAPLAQHVDLHEAQLLSRIHVVLRRREAFWRQVKGSVVGDGFLGNQHSTRMDRTLTWKVADALYNPHDFLVVLAFRQAKYFSQLMVDGVLLEGHRGS